MLCGNHPWAQNNRSRGAQVENGRFDSDAGGAGVDDEWDFPFETVADMFGTCGREFVGAIGARGGEGKVAEFNDATDERVEREAQPHSISVGGHDVGDHIGARQDKREWPWPKMAGESFCGFRPGGDAAAGHGKGGNMNNDWIVGGPAFGFVDCLNGLRIEGVCREAIDRFRGKGHKTALPEEANGLRGGGFEMRGGFYVQDRCFHAGSIRRVGRGGKE